LTHRRAQLRRTASDRLGTGDRSVRELLATRVPAPYTRNSGCFMQPAESLGTPAYQNAITAATNGISDNTGNGDFRAFHGTAPAERNMWAQFQSTSFGNDIEAGKPLTDIMNARTDPRLPAYFCLNTNNGYGGQDFNAP